MNAREWLHATRAYPSVDRGIFTLPWSGFPEIIERWNGEGLRDELVRFPVQTCESLRRKLATSQASTTALPELYRTTI